MSLTSAQQRAIAARGNVLVMAGAGTGKTSTLVARCIDCLSGNNPASLDEILVVTFTESAAAEARQRVRDAIYKKSLESADAHWAEQLALFDAAHIGTLHSFCFKLVREHFYELGLDPQIAVLDEGRAKLLANETLTDLLDEHYAGKLENSAAVQELIENYGGGSDDSVRKLVLRLHDYIQTRADPADWMARQVEMFSTNEPQQWNKSLLTGVRSWKGFWLPELHVMSPENPKAAEFATLLENNSFGTRQEVFELAEKLLAGWNGSWPPKRKTALSKPLEPFIAGAEFFAGFVPVAGKPDPLTEDWDWSRHAMLALLQLTQQFAARFAERKLGESAVDFHDLEQFALRLLVAPGGAPSAIAESWRQKFRFVFVDEYQDINAAQDRIIRALSGEGADANRFLVGDVKQSIYRFRLAEPGIFRDYADKWKNGAGQTIALRENFRSRAGILGFVNAVFAPLMRAEIGGVNYDEDAKLISGNVAASSVAGSPEAARAAQREPDVEIRLRLTEKTSASENEDALEDLLSAEKEALHIAMRLQQLKSAKFSVLDRKTGITREVEWRDMAILLRAPANKTESFAKQFARAGIPLDVARGGFYETPEVSDLLNIFKLLDNPLQDVPLIAVLRSPLVALTLDELAMVRLAARKERFWTALVRFAENEKPAPEAEALKSRLIEFLKRFSRWRTLARQGSLSKCLETILAETHYADWLRAQERGEQRYTNIQRLLRLAEEFDEFHRQGLFRFLRFIEAQQEAEAEPEVPAVAAENAVRLMSVHQSKGLEFPVVVVADLGKRFNFQDLNAEIILDEEFGLCPMVRPPEKSARYPSVTHWLAQQRQKRELLGEELRLLYVAMTRAREKLILTGTVSRKSWESLPEKFPKLTTRAISSASSAANWLCVWMPHHANESSPLFLFEELDDAKLKEFSFANNGESVHAVAPELDGATLAQLRARLDWNYPFDSATRRTAKTTVTALRRLADEELESETTRLFVSRPRKKSALAKTKQSAAEVGIAHHAFLERLTLAQTMDIATLKAEADRLLRERVLTEEQVAALDFAALERFWTSDVGKLILANSQNVRREVEFTARFTPAELDTIVKRSAIEQTNDDFAIVQGIADLVVFQPDELWLLDFKTDDVTAREVEAKKQFYAPQLQLYAAALERIFNRRVTRCWLHFLSCGETVALR